MSSVKEFAFCAGSSFSGRSGNPRRCYCATVTMTTAITVTITIYLFIPAGTVVRSHNEEHISIILSHDLKHTHIQTLRHTPPFSQSAYTNRNTVAAL